MGVRVATAKALASIAAKEVDESFTEAAVEAIISSVFRWSGEESRHMGKILRSFDTTSKTDKLLARLDGAEDSLKRSVVIEMLEEIHTSNADRRELAA